MPPAEGSRCCAGVIAAAGGLFYCYSVPTLLISLLLLKSLLLKVPAVVLAYLLLMGVSAIASVPTLLISLLPPVAEVSSAEGPTVVLAYLLLQGSLLLLVFRRC